MLVHSMTHLLVESVDLAARSGGGGILQTLRRAVVGFLVVIWLIGLIMGFALGRVTKR